MNRFPNYFADAETDFKDAKYVIFGVPYDKTSSFRYGAEKAPYDIRQASWNFESFHINTGTDLTKIPMHDYGDLDVRNKTPDEMIRIVRNFVRDLLGEEKFPITIGGEHSVSIGIIQSVKEKYDDLAVLVLDAHLDFRDIYEEERFNHACTVKRIADAVGVENIAIVGVRSAEKDEYISAKKRNLMIFDTSSFYSNGLEKVINEIKNKFGENKIYISIDFDAIDPAYAPGVETPEPFGMKPTELIETIKPFIPKSVGFDIVEVCPPYDKGETSILAAKIIRLLIDEHWRRNP